MYVEQCGETTVKKEGRNEPCPCGSGRKCKHCCWKKGFDWAVDEHGDLHRRIPIDDAELLEGLRQACVGRGPDELAFGDLGHMEHVEAEMVDIMTQAGMDPALIYAFEKTGRIVTEENKNKLTDPGLTEWSEAVDEYRRLADKDATLDI